MNPLEDVRPGFGGLFAEFAPPFYVAAGICLVILIVGAIIYYRTIARRPHGSWRYGDTAALIRRGGLIVAAVGVFTLVVAIFLTV